MLMLYFLKEPCTLSYTPENLIIIEEKLSKMSMENRDKLLARGFTDSNISHEKYLNLRYEGTDYTIMVLKPDDGDYKREFVKQYRREYGFIVEVSTFILCVYLIHFAKRGIIVDDIRVRSIGSSAKISKQKIEKAEKDPSPMDYCSCYFGVFNCPIYPHIYLNFFFAKGIGKNKDSRV
jgi:5-oxoprolinase (ATP-hydrolysing)